MVGEMYRRFLRRSWKHIILGKSGGHGKALFVKAEFIVYFMQGER